VPTGWICHIWSLYRYCKEKNRSTLTAVISMAIFTCPGRAGPVFRLDLSLSILQMTLSVTIYFPAHCGHTGSPDWGDVPQGRLWVESRPRRLRPCAVLWPFAVTVADCWCKARLTNLRIWPIALRRWQSCPNARQLTNCATVDQPRRIAAQLAKCAAHLVNCAVDQTRCVIGQLRSWATALLAKRAYCAH